MHINNVIANTNNVCVYCNLFILFRAGKLLTKVHLDFVLAIKTTIKVINNLICYGYNDNSSHLCKFCYSIIIEKKIPKFGFANCINILFYQKYPNVLSNLTLVKETLMAHVQPIMFVIKLRLGKTGSTALYH